MGRRALVLSAALMLAVCPLVDGAERTKGDDEKNDSKMVAKTFSGIKVRSIGPALMSGRVADIAIDENNPNIWYVAVGSGSVWKTTNSGTSWKPIFDDQPVYSVGCITIDPNNSNVLWVGSGENVNGRHVGWGDGVYRSADGGKSWKNMGLKETEHIGRIAVDPRDSNVVFVAAMGPLWSPGGERGLYKTVDGGTTWKQVLAAGEYTGVYDVVMSKCNPDVLYASTHQRFRNTAALVNAGPESGIHKSTDGGETWTKVSKGLPMGDIGQTGLAVSPHKPNVVYATIELPHRKGGFYRSEDFGESWTKRNDYISGGTGPHYYQEIVASPHEFDRVYQMDVRIHVTHDGGKNFGTLNEEWKHSDNHALAFKPNDPNYLLAGSDGGLYESFDLGQTWKYVANLPVTQFYKIALDNDLPFYNVYGGTQDNSTQGGPTRTDSNVGIRNADWFITLFADGHQPATDPSNPDIVYSEWQQGNLVRYDRKTGEIVYIKPQPEKGEPAERFNWDSPILVSPHSPTRLYFGSQRVWRSDDRGDSWRAISGDLSRTGGERLTKPMMGRVQSFNAGWDLGAMSEYGTVTSIEESPVVEGLIYAGTDDGLIQVTEDGGENWRQIDAIKGVPETAFINNLRADLFDADTVYALLDNHKTGDYKPYLYKSTDRGKSWTSIAGDLPDGHLVWRMVQDHVNKNLFFLGTEFGVFFSVNGGENWIKLKGGVPTIPFRDLQIQRRENDLVGASFGRGIFVLDDYTPLRHVSEEFLAAGVQLFPVKTAQRYIQRRTLGSEGKASQGDAYFNAPNPPFGAVFTYYLKDSLETRKDTRLKAEKKLAKEDEDIPFPGWDELKAEAQEEKPAVLLTVKNSAGDVVRHLSGKTSAGFHRVAWDFTYPSTRAETIGEQSRRRGGPRGGGGVMAPPGTYTVEIATFVDGQLTPAGEAQTFDVVQLREGTLPGQDQNEIAEFYLGVAEFQRSVTGANAVIVDVNKRIGAIKKALMRSTVADTALRDEARAIEMRLATMQEILGGNQQKQRIGEPAPHSIGSRLMVVGMGAMGSTYGPTPTHRRSYEIATEEFVEVQQSLNQIVETDLPALETKLEAAGVPWTPGRPVPSSK
ncbi:MAG: glycosyl hydrolase [bacterium]|nr:glycosyl hydrolase [bacterium]